MRMFLIYADYDFKAGWFLNERLTDELLNWGIVEPINQLLKSRMYTSRNASLQILNSKCKSLIWLTNLLSACAGASQPAVSTVEKRI